MIKATLVSPRSRVTSPRLRVGNQTEIITNTTAASRIHTTATHNSSTNNSNVSSILANKTEKAVDQKITEERALSPSGSHLLIRFNN